MLSILCILITCWIIVRYRTCSKTDAGHDATRNTTSPIPTQSATCNLDLHEMQNLIAKAETLAPNGVVRHSGNGNNTASEKIILNSSTPKKARNDEDFSCVFKVYLGCCWMVAFQYLSKHYFVVRLRAMSSMQIRRNYIFLLVWKRIRVMAPHVSTSTSTIVRLYLTEYIPM